MSSILSNPSEIFRKNIKFINIIKDILFQGLLNNCFSQEKDI